MEEREMKRIFMAFLILFTILPSISDATPILDQYNPLDYTTGITGYGTVYKHMDDAQTFTVGIAGILSQVSIYMNMNSSVGAENLFIDITKTLNGVPVDNPSSILGSLSLSPAFFNWGAKVDGY
jgi:hypothetical protein